MIHQVWTSQSCGQWICKDYECQALSLLSHQSGRLATTQVKDSFLQAEDYKGNVLVTEDGESQ